MVGGVRLQAAPAERTAVALTAGGHEGAVAIVAAGGGGGNTSEGGTCANANDVESSETARVEVKLSARLMTGYASMRAALRSVRGRADRARAVALVPGFRACVSGVLATSICVA